MVTAGRRIDAKGAEPRRFPLKRVDAVRGRIREVMLEYSPQWLVSSAASGSDLIALGVARELGVQRRVVLPFAAEEFRNTSVIDRPGDWGPTYDRIVRELKLLGGITDLGLDKDAHDAFAQANEAILQLGFALSSSAENVLAMVVWEGRSRGADDYTASFEAAARERGMAVTSVLTT